MSDKKELKPFPAFNTDEEAERFVEEADLSEYDFSGFRPMRYEFQTKSANMSMRVPPQLLAEIKAAASKEGMPYQRFVRQLLEEALAARGAPRKKAG